MQSVSQFALAASIFASGVGALVMCVLRPNPLGRSPRATDRPHPGSTVTDPSKDNDTVARILLADAMCVECIMAKTGLSFDRTFEAIEALEANRKLVRAWGRCRLCSKNDRALLTLA